MGCRTGKFWYLEHNKKWKAEIHNAVGSFQSIPGAPQIKSNHNLNSRVILKGTTDSLPYIFHVFLIKILDLSAQLCLIRRLEGWKMKTRALDLSLRFVLFLTQIRHQNNHSACFFFSSLQGFLMKFYLYPFSFLGFPNTTKQGHLLDLGWYKITIFYYQIPWK